MSPAHMGAAQFDKHVNLHGKEQKLHGFQVGNMRSWDRNMNMIQIEVKEEKLVQCNIRIVLTPS